MRRGLLTIFVLIWVITFYSPSAVNWAAPSASAQNEAQSEAAPREARSALTLPLKRGSVRFAVIGDMGNGQRSQYQVAERMARFHDMFPFDFVITLGDNIYGGSSPRDFKEKFEQPYRSLLDGGVKFYASLGNHDNPNERFYKLFNMSGERYYNFKKGNVEFFALDSTYMDAKQLDWLEKHLHSSTAQWKICFFHHPLYSDGKTHGPDMDLRSRLEPLFDKYGVDAVFSGHEHVYERIEPQRDVYYFVLGNSGELRYHNLRPSDQMIKGFDTDRTFMLVEIAEDELYFQTISRTGVTVDTDGLAKLRTKSGGEVATGVAGSPRDTESRGVPRARP